MKKFLVIGLIAGIAASGNAQWFMRGEFNAWGTDSMTDLGGGHWQGTINSLTPGQGYEYKVALADWSDSSFASNGRFIAGSSGSVTIDFWENAPADGWSPMGAKRTGYSNGDAHGWDIMGSFNGWSSPFTALTSLGSGMYSATAFVSTGDYEFKFRKDGDWGVSVGSDFGNSAGNIALNVPADGMYKFDLDVTNGRYRATAVPEPASMAVLGLGAIALLKRRRK